MKDVFKPRPKDGPQGEPPFWERFSGPKSLLLLLCALLLGVAVGAALAVFFPLFQGRWMMPLQFSGIPVAGSGFISCFTTLLLNVLIGLVPLFLLGVTAFGVFAVPLFLFFRGITAGIGVSYFLWRDELLGLARSAYIHRPPLWRECCSCFSRCARCIFPSIWPRQASLQKGRAAWI